MSKDILDQIEVEEPKNPGDCTHPLEHRRFDGVQEGFNRKPQLIISTCLSCGTSLSDSIEHSESVWWAIGQLMERVKALPDKLKKLEDDLRKAGQFL